MLRVTSVRRIHPQVHTGRFTCNGQFARCFSGSPQGDTKEIVDAKIACANDAQQKFLSYDQKQVDLIFQKVAHAAAKARIPLARATVNETQMGCFEDKVIKNSVACEMTFSRYKDAKTVGVIDSDPITMLTKVAVPVCPIAAIIPVTNPTSTVITKALFALKTRNTVVFLPHPKAAQCTAAAVKVCHDAAVLAGAPHGCLQVVFPSREISQYTMHHKGVNMLLATGGPSMVQACYESGKPSLGVGAGNAPVIIDETYKNLEEAVGLIVLSKTFDNGVICASEQSIVAVETIYDKLVELFKKRGVHFVEGEDRKKVAEYINVDGHINPNIVGQTAIEIAKRVGITVPEGTVVLAAACTEVGPHEPFSGEKLSPLLGFYRVKNFDDAAELAHQIVLNGGKGHTAAIYSEDRERLNRFAKKMPAFHLMANMPTALGAIGTSFNFNVDPSLTLGVGSIGGSSLSGPLTPFHLLDIKTLAERQEHLEWLKNPPSVYFNRNCTEQALVDLANNSSLKRCVLITDKMMVQLGHVHRIQTIMEKLGFECAVFDDINPDPDMTSVRKGVNLCNSFRPDTMVCIGGGSPMDAGKFIRVIYEHPEISIEDLAARFVELRKRTQSFPQQGSKIHTLVCIPTTSGTASEVTPFSVITDDHGHKHPLFSYSMTPDIAIVDSSYCDNLPKSLIAYAGLDAITHAVESYVSVAANDFTMPSAVRGLKLVFNNLAQSYNVGDHHSRELVHNGATIAGLSFSNAYLGICHSLSHQIGGAFHLPHGLVNAILLPYVMEYNAVEKPTRMGIYPTYGSPQSLKRYAELGRAVGCSGNNDKEVATNFVIAFQRLCTQLGVPKSFKEVGVDANKFEQVVPQLAEQAFDDQCTPGNPRFPLVTELQGILRNSFYGKDIEFK